MKIPDFPKIRTNDGSHQVLEDLEQLCDKLNATNSKNDKIEILKAHPQCKRILEYTYNPYKMFGVTSKVAYKKGGHYYKNGYSDIFALLDDLTNRVITGQDALDAVNVFQSNHINYRDVIANIIDKNLKTRTDVKVINKAFPGLIPEFNVALAQKYEDHAHKIDWLSEQWFWSRKLDGVRVLARVEEDGSVKFFSRKGKEFSTLGFIEDEIKNLQITNCVLDGEMCILDARGHEKYKDIVSLIKRKDYTIGKDDLMKPVFKVFDVLTLEEFDKGQSTRKLTDRIGFWFQAFGESSCLNMLSMQQVRDEAHVGQLLEQAETSGWEGIMIRRNIGYEGKRSRNLLKVKKMHDAEYKVIRMETGPFRIINPETGLEDTIETMTNVIIEHKGNEVSVGSGFSQADRRKYYDNPDEIVGRDITVQYFEETQDKDGNYSLRFPVVKMVFEEEGRLY